MQIKKPFLYFTNRLNEADVLNVPPDYMVSLLESLASICHYCLRDNTAPQSPALSLKPRIARSNSSPAVGVNSDLIQSSGSSVFTNLLHAFSVQSAPVSDVPSVEVPKHILDAREDLLSVLPKILSSLFTIWSTWSPQRTDSTSQRLPSECPLNLMGSPKVGIATSTELRRVRLCANSSSRINRLIQYFLFFFRLCNSRFFNCLPRSP